MARSHPRIVARFAPGYADKARGGRRMMSTCRTRGEVIEAVAYLDELDRELVAEQAERREQAKFSSTPPPIFANASSET